MNKKRPINLALTTMHFPPMAIASVLHRLSGVVLFLMLPLMLWWLSQSLESATSFALLQHTLASPLNKLALWLFGSALIYHILAGIRHIIMDLGFGEHLCAGRRTALLVIILAIILAIFLGIWVW